MNIHYFYSKCITHLVPPAACTTGFCSKYQDCCGLGLLNLFHEIIPCQRSYYYTRVILFKYFTDETTKHFRLNNYFFSIVLYVILSNYWNFQKKISFVWGKVSYDTCTGNSMQKLLNTSPIYLLLIRSKAWLASKLLT